MIKWHNNNKKNCKVFFKIIKKNSTTNCLILLVYEAVS